MFWYTLIKNTSLDRLYANNSILSKLILDEEEFFPDLKQSLLNLKK